MAATSADPEGRPGIAVDARGGAVIDPTKNVLDLVRAGMDNQDAQRGALKELLVEKVEGLEGDSRALLSESQERFQNGQRESETKRIDQVASTRQEFQNTIRDMLCAGNQGCVPTSTASCRRQLVQIQATFDTRASPSSEAGARSRRPASRAWLTRLYPDAITRNDPRD